MSKSIKLDIKPDFNFTLIGMVTSEQIYRLSWLINELLGIKLKESSPLQIYHTKRQVIQEYPKFSFYADDESCFNLIHNKSQHGLLIEEQKHVDYWLKIDNSLFKSAEIVNNIKALKNITMVFEINPDSLKSKVRLVFSNKNDSPINS